VPSGVRRSPGARLEEKIPGPVGDSRETMKNFKLVALLLLTVLLAWACARDEGAFSEEPAGMTRPQASPSPGLLMRLSQGQAQAGPADRLPTPATTPMTPAEVQALLARLPEFQTDAGKPADFALREGSLPAPRTGTTVQQPFPPVEAAPTGAPTSSEGPLEVLRRAPEGEVPLAPQVSVTFSQPMVTVSSQAEASQSVPVRLTPQPPGAWRWIGTRTVVFDPAEQRLPMATRFTVQVPAGTRPQTGEALARTASWNFTTPPPRMVGRHPQGGSQPLHPLLFLAFDQRIQPQAVLKTLKVRVGDSEHPVRLANDNEIAGDARIQELIAGQQPGRFLVLRTVKPLPGDSTVQVTLGPGTPSAEGPLTSTKTESFNFHTYGPLKVVDHRCGWGEQCPPLTPWQIEFSNELDPETFDPDQQLHVTPQLPGMKAALHGDRLTLMGRSKGRTTYTVTVRSSVRDVFGQTLGQDVPLKFEVGPARPALHTVGGPLVVVDPQGKPTYSVFTVNQPALKVQLFQVTPQDWPAYVAWARESWRDPRPELPGKKIFDGQIPVKAPADEYAETGIDLSAALVRGKGHVLVMVEPTAFPEGQRRSDPMAAWVQVTGIGLDAFLDSQSLVAWASSLVDGRPLGDVQLELTGAGTTGRTGTDGTATMDLGSKGGLNDILLARLGDDVAFLPQAIHGGRGWTRRAEQDTLRWFIFDDRGLYRPGETVHLKGWARRVGAGPKGDLMGLAEAARTVTWTLLDSRRNQIAQGEAALSSLGGFDFTLSLPGTMNLGQAVVQLAATGGSGGLAGMRTTHTFGVEEFRRPEFEVQAEVSDGIHLVGGSATATVSAAYYAGGGLPDAEVNWIVTATPGHFSPPGWDEFTFGTWTPWWDYGFFPSNRAATTIRSLEGRTDSSGRHRLAMDFLGVEPPGATSVEAAASVQDVNRQTWSASTQMLVHPSEHYVGLKTPRTFVEAGQPIRLEAVLSDLDGKPQAGRSIHIRSARLDYQTRGGEWREVELDVHEQTVQSASRPVPVLVQPKQGGTWQITATVRDAKGRPNQTRMTVWVAGGVVPRGRGVEQEKVPLVPDRKEYLPGQTAEILVQAPFTPAEGVLTLRRSGRVLSQRFRVEKGTHTLRIPIHESYIPNVHIQVDLVGATLRTDASGAPDKSLPTRPAYASGSLNLSVPALQRSLKLSATPREQGLEPGGTTTVEIELRDSADRPVSGGEVAVVVADEAVLALTGYDVADPLETFYANRGPEMDDFHLREFVQLASSIDLSDEASRPRGGLRTKSTGLDMEDAMGLPPPSPSMMMMAEAMPEAANFGGGGGAEPGPAIRMRTDFNPLALFKAALPTDQNGRAQVTLKVPDNLTRYRITAVAVAGEKYFGKGESTVVARLPLMVRPSAPRFLNFGDRLELPVVVQNQTDRPLNVQVALRTRNLKLTDGAGRKLTVPANDRVEVRFPAAAEQAGQAAFQVGATSGTYADAAEVGLPVWTPATTEAFATYGHLDQGATIQPVSAPGEVWPQFGGLEITTTSTALQELTDAVLYLVAYPFECAEQVSSRVLAIAALKDVLAAFQAEGLPSAKEMVAAVARDIEHLRNLQRPDGGFGFWRRDDRDFPYVSVHAAHALVRAKEKGFQVPQDMLDRSKTYLRTVEKHIPAEYSPLCRRAIAAYALEVRLRMGDPDPAKARALFQEAGLEGLSLEALGWLLPTLAQDPGSSSVRASIQGHLANRVAETAGSAHFTTSYSDQDYLLLASDRRTDGVLLSALIQDQPKSDLIPKLVRGLLEHRTRGRWGNTQENVFILLALDRYFQTYEKTTPDFVARLWLGQTFAGEQKFQGRSTERKHTEVPMSWLAGKGRQDLTLAKEGPGRLYYRIGMRYAPKDLHLDPADHGFTVQRTYHAVDNPKDVRRDPDGTWRIQAGTRVQTRISLVAPTRRTHVALVDPLPAGLEPLNPTLAVTEKLPEGVTKEANRPGFWWWGPWYEHENLRDERAEAFTSLLWEGVYEYTYVSRATTPGHFVVPPPKAEEMYHPETFGRGGTDRVIVEP